eukprot:258759_1
MSKFATYFLAAISIVGIIYCIIYFNSMDVGASVHQVSPCLRTPSTQSGIHFNFDNVSYDIIDGAMTREVKQLFMSTILNRKSYIEWGSGGSTKLAPYLIHSESNHIFSIEHVKEWCLKMQQQNNLSIALNKLHYFCVDVKVSPLRLFGYPPLHATREQIATFSDIYVNQIDVISKAFHVDTFDIVFIDGRFRAACALKQHHPRDQMEKLFILCGKLLQDC